jgi:hypothetical protein
MNFPQNKTLSIQALFSISIIIDFNSIPTEAAARGDFLAKL